MTDLLQIAGALLILAPFIGVQLGRLHPESLTYLWLNLVGSGLLATLAAMTEQWGFLILELTWAIVSLVALLMTHAEPKPGGCDDQP